MCDSPETTDETGLLDGWRLREKILASFPLCDLKEEDLTQNPQFCKLLASLRQHIDQNGLTKQLTAELVEAEKKLQHQMCYWLQFESLHRGLEEMIQEHLVKKQHTDVSPDQNTFLETMEKCLLAAQCVKRLDPSSTTHQDQPPLLGLTPEDVKKALPPEEVVRRTKISAAPQLEKHLKGKCLSLLTYYDPELDNKNENAKTMKLSQLPGQLKKDKKRAESLKETCEEKRVVLLRQTHIYISELMKCIELLETFIHHHRMKVQADLDEKQVDYLNNKSMLLHQKLKSEVNDLLLQTYTPDTLAAHKKIRKELESKMKACEEEKQSLESKLTSFQVLGEEFQALAQEYSRIKEEIKVKTWAADEFQRLSEKS
ncbi:HAUS augmin-like complex subunit 4 [Salarias fasciatus]|uniref:HAUS augmin-like complex subunit 4 n=1 Tax=Salarias fasciatus TaxID=181472 RepID=UPI001176550A|nr:HAUS augmin-like complex subunit 4 [Salarias fasciatus]